MAGALGSKGLVAMKKSWIYSTNLVSRVMFLLLTPTLFQAFNFAFIWHSIYWGAITLVVVIWSVFVLFAPLFGRIGCGWFCFMGTIQDITSQRSLFPIKWNKPLIWAQAIATVAFFATAIAFYTIRYKSGSIDGIRMDLWFLEMNFGPHYKHVWIYDAIGAILFGLLLERRWICRNLCFMGALCSIGASFSRLLAVVDTSKCNRCGRCESDCLVRIPIRDYVEHRQGLIANSQCLLCGRCIESCRSHAISIKFVWNRKRFLTLAADSQRRRLPAS